MDRGAWWAAVHGVAKSRRRLSDFTFTFHFHALEKEMATHSSVLAWTIPGTGEPGGLPSMGSHRVGHDWSDLAAAAAAAFHKLTVLTEGNSALQYFFLSIFFHFPITVSDTELPNISYYLICKKFWVVLNSYLNIMFLFCFYVIINNFYLSFKSRT